jgi:pimeloyl-ACP methyl ester carboxylesterase
VASASLNRYEGTTAQLTQERCMLNTVVYGQAGAVPPLMIVHGLFGSARNWGVIARRLSEVRQVIAVDLRNHAGSPWYDRHSYPDLAGDLASLITRPTDVLGHSMGGKAAMALALTQPQTVNRLIVADIAPVTYDHSQMGPIDAMRKVDLATVNSRAEAAAQMTGLDAGVVTFLLQSLDLKERRWRLNLDVLAAEMAQIIGFPDLQGSFAGPTLFLSGADSDYVRPTHRPTIKALFPNAQFAKIPGAGHWLHADKPQEFTAAVDAFLKGTA